MQVLFALWLLMVGMADVLWEGGLETDAAAPTGAGEVVASEGPVGPPPPNP